MNRRQFLAAFSHSDLPLPDWQLAGRGGGGGGARGVRGGGGGGGGVVAGGGGGGRAGRLLSRLGRTRHAQILPEAKQPPHCWLQRVRAGPEIR